MPNYQYKWHLLNIYSIINAAGEVFSEDTSVNLLFPSCLSLHRGWRSTAGAVQVRSENETRSERIVFLSHFEAVRDNLPEELDPAADYFEATYQPHSIVKVD